MYKLLYICTMIIYNTPRITGCPFLYENPDQEPGLVASLGGRVGHAVDKATDGCDRGRLRANFYGFIRLGLIGWLIDWLVGWLIGWLVG